MIEWNPNYLSVKEILSQPDGSTVNIIGDIFALGVKNESTMLIALEMAALMPNVKFATFTNHMQRAIRLMAGTEEIEMCTVWGETVEQCTTECLNWLMRHPDVQISPEIREVLNARGKAPYMWPLKNFEVQSSEAE